MHYIVLQYRSILIIRPHGLANMTFKLSPPSLAEHLGFKARARLGRRQVSARTIEVIEDKVAIDAVNMRKEVGLKTASDGEY